MVIPSSVKRIAVVAVAAGLLPSLGLGEQVFVRTTNGEVETLDPHQTSSSAEGPIVVELFEGLTTVDQAGETIPGAAAGWSVSDDGRTWVFTLREGLVWSDGVALDAEDFVWSLRRSADPATRNPLAGQLFVIKNARAVGAGELKPEALGVRALAGNRVEITLEHPAPYLPDLLFSNGLPVPRHVIERYGAEWIRPGNMVSNGAFVLSERVPQSHVAVRRNPRFRAADSVRLVEVRFVANEDLATGVNRFRAGEVHTALNFPQRQLDLLREKIPTAIRLAPFLGYDYYAFNTTKPPFDDVRVRRALSMAVNREILASRIMRTGDRPAYSYVAPGTANYPNRPQVSFESLSMTERQAKARELLRQAGFGPDNPLQLELRFNSRDDIRNVAVAVSAMWRQIGVKAALLNTEARSHVSELVAGNFQLGRWLAFADFNDPLGFLRRFTSDASAGMNVARYSNQEFDRLIAQANNTANVIERAGILAQAERIVLEDHPIMPLYFIVSKRLVAPEVQGWVDNLRGVNLLRYVALGGKE